MTEVNPEARRSRIVPQLVAVLNALARLVAAAAALAAVILH